MVNNTLDFFKNSPTTVPWKCYHVSDILWQFYFSIYFILFIFYKKTTKAKAVLGIVEWGLVWDVTRLLTLISSCFFIFFPVLQFLSNWTLNSVKYWKWMAAFHTNTFPKTGTILSQKQQKISKKINTDANSMGTVDNFCWTDAFCTTYITHRCSHTATNKNIPKKANLWRKYWIYTHYQKKVVFCCFQSTVNRKKKNTQNDRCLFCKVMFKKISFNNEQWCSGEIHYKLSGGIELWMTIPVCSPPLALPHSSLRAIIIRRTNSPQKWAHGLRLISHLLFFLMDFIHF